MPHIGGFEENF